MSSTASAANPLSADLNHVLAHTAGVWDQLRGARLFVTGGTGFVGSWLRESFVWAREVLALDAELIVLTRHPALFRSTAPHLAGHPGIRLMEGDVRTFEFPVDACSHVIHAAADPGQGFAAHARSTVDTVIDGTRRVLDFARASGVRSLLFVSSGAVYGRQPPDLPRMAEDYAGGPALADPASAYGESKRVGELLAIAAGQAGMFDVKIARLFAFAGPYLPIDSRYAIGNFIRDALAGAPIRVTGDGTPRRSYLYAADLAVWLWTMLVKGLPSRAYNVGSSRDVSIAETARAVAAACGTSVQIAQLAPAGAAPSRYVPDTARAESELGLRARVDLEQAVARTLAWHRHREGMRTAVS